MGNTGLKQHYETASKTGVLQLSGHKLKEVPENVVALSDTLRNLDLSNNRLPCLPDNIRKFKHLKQLDLHSNKLEALPESLANCQKLDMLKVSNNMISLLPQSFQKLSNLKQIYLNHNKIKEFPIELLNLTSLEVIELSNNKISKVPNGMSNLYAVELNLSQNEISSLSEDLHLAPKLKILKLEENCLSLDAVNSKLLRDSKIHTLNLDGNLFEIKQLASLEGYTEYTERYTAVKKKMF